MLRIFLSELAENKLDAILAYLVEEWSKNRLMISSKSLKIN